MSHDSSNPFESPTTASHSASNENSDLTTVDWLLCIFCAGIACIIGIIRLIQGKPNGGKMIGLALLFTVLWGLVRLALESIAANQ